MNPLGNCLLAVSLILLGGMIKGDEKLLKDIETNDDIRGWEFKNCTPEVSRDKALLGKASLKITPGVYMPLFSRSGLVGDWSAYDALQIDFHNTTGKSLKLYILIGDKDWQGTGQYWDRYNGNHTIPNGSYTFTLPITGLYRGEAGSRFNNIKHAINPAEIVRIDFGVGNKNQKDLGPVYMDNFRLVRTKLPEYVKAFDFGPTEQNTQMGFTPVTWNTVYDASKGYGLKQAASHQNRARDDTFPPGPLYRDWVIMSESWKDYEFMVDLPNGSYEVFTCFSDPGYWGGEAIRHTKRHIHAEGRTVWSEDLGAHGNYWKPNYLFENVEPLVGQDFWEVYMEKIFAPQRFTVKVKDKQLNLTWSVDNHWSCKVNSVIIYPTAKKAEGHKLIDSIVANERKAFTVAATEHAPPAGGSLAGIPAAEKSKGYIFFLTDYMKDTYQTTIPEPSQIKRELAVSACLGEWEPITLAVRPLKDMGKAKLTVSDFIGPAGTLPGGIFERRVVRHLSSRGFSAINYRIIPLLVKKFDEVDLPKNITREFLLWGKIPKDAAPGVYKGTVTLTSTGGINETVNVTLKVYPFTLDNSDYVFGFYGTIQRYEDAKLLRDLGFNSFSGGYPIDLKGFAKDGAPDMDFTKMDAYMDMLQLAGYTQEGWGYGGFTVSHIGYTKDEVFFGKWEKETGLSYVELLRRVFAAMEAHARQKNWLPGVYGLVDETRNVEVAKRQVAQINAINEASNWIKTGGSYSVQFAKGRNPKDYHQWIFDALDVSSLNNHDMEGLAEARKLGKEVYIYNQGRSRYSFGAYQWSEKVKGVKGRHQWHLHVQHGFQFFDLDGREPDTASMLYYGEHEPIPTLNLVRCAEGADDFYYCQTLSNRIEKLRLKGGPAATKADEAKGILTEIETRIKLNERRKPDWLDNDKLRQACAEAIAALDK